MNLPRLTAIAFAVASAQGASTVFAQEELILEEIVVTAQKREESTQDIPSTVNAVTGESLEQFNVFDFADVERLTPGLSLTSVSPRNQAISLRGITFNPDSASAPAVVTYWNGIHIRAVTAFSQMFDVDRIEVLRGPQGTLQGATSPAGSIQIHTRQPSMDQIEAHVQQSFSDNEGSNTQAAIGIPIISNVLSMRIAGVYDENELLGVKNLSNGGEQSSRSHGGRFTLSWLPTDSFSAVLTYENLDRQFTGFEVVESVPGGTAAPVLDAFDLKALTEGPSLLKNRHALTALEMKWEFAGHELTSLSGYQVNRNFADRDLDFGNAVPNFVRRQLVDTSAILFNQELRIASLDSERLEYMVGLYYRDNDPKTFNRNLQGVFISPDPNTPPVAEFDFDVVALTGSEQIGAFFNTKYHFTDATNVQFGLRWQKIRSRFTTDGYVGGNLVINLVPSDRQRNTDEAVTGSLKLTHHLNDDMMLYGSIDRGFRNAGITITPTALEPDLLLWDEETSDSIELGFKSSLWGGRARLNGALFYQQFDGYISRSNDLFVDVQLNDGIAETAVTGGLTFNGDAIIQGAELEFNALISENLTAFASVSYADANYDGAQIPCNVFNASGQAIIPAGQTGQAARCDADGQRIGGEPNFSASANIEYTLPAGSLEYFVRGLYKFTDHRSNELIPNADVAAYGVADLFAGVRDQGGAWNVSVWAKNLFDKRAVTNIGAEDIVNSAQTPFSFQSGYRVVSVIPERTVGVTARYNFEM